MTSFGILFVPDANVLNNACVSLLDKLNEENSGTKNIGTRGLFGPWRDGKSAIGVFLDKGTQLNNLKCPHRWHGFEVIVVLNHKEGCNPPCR